MRDNDSRRVPLGHPLGAQGLKSAGSVMKQMAPELVVSKQKLRQAEGSCLVRIKREEKNQTLAFSSRPFVLCGLPVRRPRTGELLFERRNGSFVLQITGHPEFGLPFGQDRLVPIYLATLAVQQKSQTVRFRSGAEMLETFGMQKGGKEYKRLVGAFERILFNDLLRDRQYGWQGQAGAAIALQLLTRSPDLTATWISALFPMSSRMSSS